MTQNNKNKNKNFTDTDYLLAAQERLKDSKYLRTNEQHMIFAIYCAGVSIECMLRGYINKYTKEFDEKHNIERLYKKSLLASILDMEEKIQLAAAIKTAKVWDNDFRYTSEKRMKRLIAHKYVNNGKKGNKNRYKDLKSYFKHYFSEFFMATEIIIKKGEEKWQKI